MATHKLTISLKHFYSATDEQVFFTWLQSISGVLAFEGMGEELVVTLKSNRPSQAALRELIAIHYRYGLPMKSLAQFETPTNNAWFCAPQAYWHSQVFG